MHIKGRNRQPLTLMLHILLLTFLIICGCQGKEDKQLAGIPTPTVTGQQETTAETTGAATSQKSAPAPRETTSFNTAPRITKFDVEPKNPTISDTIRLSTETSDKEGDTVTIIYQWAKNDIPLSETSGALSLSKGFNRGDKISVKAIPDDGKVRGTQLTMVVYVANASPVFKDVSETFGLQGGLYTHQVKATDPDGDTLTFSLKSGPPDMTVDTKTGFIQWQVPSDFAGKSQYAISVTDSHGGETIETVTLEIRPR